MSLYTDLNDMAGQSAQQPDEDENLSSPTGPGALVVRDYQDNELIQQQMSEVYKVRCCPCCVL